MGQNFFTYLPSEIIVNILSRLPIRSIIRCKHVCKSWLDLLVTPEFVRSHISKSVPGLVVFVRNPQIKPYKFVEFVDELDPNFDEHRWNAVFNFNLPFHVPVHSEANGLLFLWEPDFLIICNPITRDYITFPFPLDNSSVLLESYGFGVSRISGQYKVVGMFFKKEIDTPQQAEVSRSECLVYSVGTGSWRRIASAALLDYEFKYDTGAFLNGNLHWLAHARDLNGYSERISCFVLETELFSTCSPPPRDDPRGFRNLSVLGGCLCLCDNLGCEFPSEYDIAIWLMKEYGDEKSWTKEYVICKMFHADFLVFLCPIKVFEDGDILMEIGIQRLVYYSNKTETIREVDVSGSDCTAISYTPSFVSLKTIAMENVVSF
ncbi:hypothetical protein C2S53_001693 [Perilla frutescens var. hirtella]|uniref:F-box domain-containing protein n=1 Tax=Perilla frutescens var. hirtella TaxID=608512 RepID=A0AAD4P4U1_PERFH|nr:hypothetical protein C2S53_001693 [Perilla frutescens var. hirtella]